MHECTEIGKEIVNEQMSKKPKIMTQTENKKYNE